MAIVPPFPSIKATALLRVLGRLGYTMTRSRGSHRVLEAPGRPQLVLAYHSGQTFPPGLVRKILVKDVGLGEDEALRLLT